MQRVLITGAGRGIGLELARQCLDRGDHVFAAVRDVDAPELVSLGGPRLEIVRLDVRSPGSIAECRAAVGERADGLDLLVNNAAIHAWSPEIEPPQRNLAFGHLEPEGLTRMFQVNALGPALVTQAFTDLLVRGERPRVVVLSSRKGSLGTRCEGGNYGYTVSKAALNMVGRALANDLRPLGIVVALVHPGSVRTRMGGPEAELDVGAAVGALLTLSDRLTIEDSGRFLRSDGTEHPW